MKILLADFNSRRTLLYRVS